MNLDAINQSSATDLKSKMEDKKLKEACQDFEALFIGQMFKSMRNTVPEGGLVEKGQGERIYRDMHDMEVASNLAKGKGIGLAESLFNQLKRDMADD